MTDPTGTALLAACAANPDELDCALRYADYLQECGDDVRAEFIRVQCGIEQHDPDKCVHCVAANSRTGGEGRGVCHGRAALRIQESSLLDAHEAEWRKAGPCPECGGSGRVRATATGGSKPCPVCDGTGDRGGLLCLLFYPPPGFESADGLTLIERVRIRFRRGLLDRIDAHIDHAFHCDSNSARSVWRPTPLALSWLREFPTVREVRLVDRVANNNVGDANGPNKDLETFDWWDVSKMAMPPGTDRNQDYIPSIIHKKIVSLYPENAVRRDGYLNLSYGLIEFTTSKDANTALARATAEVIRDHL